MPASLSAFHNPKRAFCIVKKHDAEHHGGFSF
jgi:hypothetical protein